MKHMILFILPYIVHLPPLPEKVIKGGGENKRGGGGKSPLSM